MSIQPFVCPSVQTLCLVIAQRTVSPVRHSMQKPLPLVTQISLKCKPHKTKNPVNKTSKRQTSRSTLNAEKQLQKLIHFPLRKKRCYRLKTVLSSVRFGDNDVVLSRDPLWQSNNLYFFPPPRSLGIPYNDHYLEMKDHHSQIFGIQLGV